MKAQKYLYPLFSLLILLLATSCEKVIDVDIKDDTGKLVIEGKLTDVSGVQTIKISRSVAFANTNTYPAVSGAIVILTDPTGRQYNFTETAAGTYTYPRLSGIAGNAYSLSVLLDGKTYTASSTMPTLIPLDSLTYQKDPTDDEQRQIVVHYVDQPYEKNQYRFILFVNGEQVKTVFAANDEFTNGRMVNTILRLNDDADTDILPGDQVTVEMQCIDPAIYTYWYTLSQQQSSGPFGGTTAADPPSNLNNGALGYFSAHFTQTRTITVR